MLLGVVMPFLLKKKGMLTIGTEKSWGSLRVGIGLVLVLWVSRCGYERDARTSWVVTAEIGNFSVLLHFNLIILH